MITNNKKSSTSKQYKILLRHYFKEVAIANGLERGYEVGSVFPTENSVSSRHLTDINNKESYFFNNPSVSLALRTNI